MRKALLGVALALWLAPAAHAAATSRILYASDWTGEMEIFAVDPSGKAPPAQLTHWHGACSVPPDYHYPFDYPFGTLDLVPAPSGRHLLVRCGRSLWLMRGDGGDAHRIAEPSGSYPYHGGALDRPVWSRDSKAFAYKSEDGVHVRRIADASEGVVAALPPAWPAETLSPNGRWEARMDSGSVTIVRTRDGAPMMRAAISAYALRWSPDGRRLAIGSHDGISVVDMRTQRLRMLSTDARFDLPSSSYVHRTGIDFAWAPDGKAIVYVKGNVTYDGSDVAVDSRALSTVGLTGRTRVVVPADRAYGGRTTEVAWTKTFSGAHYEAPEPMPDARITPEGLLADGTIYMLAADGKRVAYESCNNISVWTPSSGTIQTVHRAETRGTPGSCAVRDRYLLYDLALAGDRVVYALSEGCMAITLTLFAAPLSPGAAGTPFARGYTNCGAPYSSGVGRLAGAGDVVVFDDWHETTPESAPGYFTTTTATVRRLDGGSCPCPVLASTPGPLYPGDVDDGRVVVYGTNGTLVLDRDGRRLLSLAIAPSAVQLSGSQLLLVSRGRLLVYDVRSAELLHSWSLPDVAAGPFCLWRTCPPHELTLHDAARGLAAYTVDGRLHLLRISDGVDSVLARAFVARFMDTGLVYADGSRLHLVPFSELPVRGF